MFAIGEASKRSGVSVETIRYYEREGIVPKPGRAANGRRLYSDDEISELAFIKRCRDLGFSLPDVRALRSLSESIDRACAEVAGLGERHLADVRSKIADLRKIETALQELVASCERGEAKCAMLETLLAEDNLA